MSFYHQRKQTTWLDKEIVLILQIELATNEFPYSKWQTPFEQIKQVVMEDPPQLPPGRFSSEFEDFVVQW